jgi:hypothetical protein
MFFRKATPSLKNGDTNGKNLAAEDVKINPRSREAFFQRMATFSVSFHVQH